MAARWDKPRGLDRFFTLSPRAVIENSLNVTEAYLREQVQTVGGDVMAMGADVARAKPFIDQNRESMRQFLTSQAALRRLSSAMLIDSDQRVLDTAAVAPESVALRLREFMRSSRRRMLEEADY